MDRLTMTEPVGEVLALAGRRDDVASGEVDRGGERARSDGGVGGLLRGVDEVPDGAASVEGSVHFGVTKEELGTDRCSREILLDGSAKV